MNYQKIAIAGLLFLTSCGMQSRFSTSEGHSGEGFIPRQEVVAKEIISIQKAFGDTLLRLENNTNSANIFLEELESYASRLDKISQELDALGPFPANLREAAMRDMENDQKAFDQLSQGKSNSILLRPEVAKVVEKAADRYFSAMISVSSKSGLEYKVKR